jgi:ABC-type oligopeptide transport system, periplasmic component
VVGSGPYVLKEWKPREQFVLEINPDYKGPIKPYFQQIIGKPIKEQKTADIAFKAGEIDFERIEPDNKKAFAALPDTSVTELQGIDYVWFGPISRRSPSTICGFARRCGWASISMAFSPGPMPASIPGRTRCWRRASSAIGPRRPPISAMSMPPRSFWPMRGRGAASRRR